MEVKTILVVVDAPADGVELERVVSAAGYEVACMQSGDDTVAAISERKPDLVILDMATDEMDGFRICRKLSTNPGTRKIPVVLVSDGEQRVDRLWAEQQGAGGLIAKPYTDEEVLDQIRRLS